MESARWTNTSGRFVSPMMLIEFGDAFDFTAAELGASCREVGFARIETVPLEGASTAAIAYKEARWPAPCPDRPAMVGVRARAVSGTPPRRGVRSSR